MSILKGFEEQQDQIKPIPHLRQIVYWNQRCPRLTFR